MKRIYLTVLVFCFFPILAQAQSNWAQWRGPGGNGVAPGSNPPTTWSEEQNIRWKVELPGHGHATPLVWGDRIYIQTSVDNQRDDWVVEYDVLALSRKNGEVVWRQNAVKEAPHEDMRREASWASPSPVTDGEHLYAFFGSRGLFCYDMDGNLKWKKNFGNMSTFRSFGEGSSPALHGDTLVILWDHEGDSFIVALNKKTGEEIWKKDRGEGTTWTTPLIVEQGGKAQVIVPATGKCMSYDLANGDVIWESPGLTRNVIPSPVYNDGVVYLMSGFRGNAIQAVDLAKAKGDITGTDAIVWTFDQDTPYVPSPVLYGDHLYFLKSNNAILSCFNAKTGKANYGPVRLEGTQGFYASPVGASNRVYFASQNGTTVVVKNGAEFEVLATNVLDESFNASPIIVDDELYLRGAKYLYCIASE